MRYFLAYWVACHLLGHRLVYKTQEMYPYCPRCDRVFWGGDLDIEEALEEVNANADHLPAG